MKKQMTEKLNTNKGITLIALVITIIVMLILVAVTISMAVNGGLFEYAGRASANTNNAIREEQQLASGKVTIDNKVYNSIDEYLEAQKGGAGNEENNAGEDIQGIDGEIFTALYAETKSYTDKNGKIAIIPKGFSVGKSDGINTIDDGLVIQDAKANQFVWIPVEYTASGTKDEKGLDSGFKEAFKRNTDDESYTEPYTDGSEGEDTEYYEMMLSVQKNKGFYVGRFEAGTEEPRYEGVANGTDTLVVKRDVYPYNYVAWGKSMDDYTSDVTWKNVNYGKGAVYLSKHLLDKQTTDAVSTLCYGVQWDAMLDFIDEEYDVNDGTKWGNQGNSVYDITRLTAKYGTFVHNPSTYTNVLAEWRTIPSDGKEKASSEMILLTTGASEMFKTKNIYDIAGNAYEYTMEVISPYYRVVRGNACDSGGSVGRRGYNDPDLCGDILSFRCAIYIK